jgi:apolipoprotein N-acyltransferase
VLLALSFPKYGHPAIAFIALVPLLVALSGWDGRNASLPGVPARRGFILGLITGFVHYLGTMYWTAATVYTFGGLPVAFGVFVVILLALAMAMFVAGAAALIAISVRHFGARGLWLAPSAWVTFEFVRGTYVFGGFPWIPLGNTMVTLLPVAQLASVVGVFGLSWFVAFLNAGFALAAMSEGRRRIIVAAATMAFIVAASLWGGMRLSSNTLTNGAPIKVGIIQGNIAQTDKWDPSRARMILNRYLQLSREAAANGAQLLIWPEAATPFYFEGSPAGSGMIRSMVRQLGVPLLLGSDEDEDGDPPRSYNSAFMLDVGGATAAVHRKMHLVPFGEYVPLQKVLFFIGPLVEAVSAFSPGTRVTMLPVDGHMINTAICFEAAFPSFHREAVRQGSELLTTITNDAWYGESSAPYQHFELAAMRAIEQGRYLVRSANTGFSGIVDPYGRVLLRTNLFETTAVVGEARFVQAKTVYATIGDLAAFMSAAVVMFVLVWALVQDRKTHANR